MDTAWRMRLGGLSILLMMIVHGASAAQQREAPISHVESLQGHRAMAVEVVSDWQGSRRAISPDSHFSSMIEQMLRTAGIDVLPPGDYPRLRLRLLNNCCVTLSGTYFTYDTWLMNFSFVQLVPSPWDSARTMEAKTWRSTHWSFTAGPNQTGRSMNAAATDLTRFFLDQFHEANSRR